MDTEEYISRPVSISFIIDEVFEGYGTGVVHFQDSGTEEAHFQDISDFQARQASFLECHSNFDADEQVSLLSEFDNRHIAKPLLKEHLDQHEDGPAIIAVQSFKMNLHEMTKFKRFLFWEIGDNIVWMSETFRNFLMIMMELVYIMHERRVFVAQRDILKNIAFKSEEDLQNPLLIRLQRHIGHSEVVEGLRVLKIMLVAIIAEGIDSECLDYELKHFMTLLDNDTYFNTNKKELIMAHPVSQTSLGKKKLLMEMWTNCRRRTFQLSWFEESQNKIELLDWKSRLRAKSNLEGLIKLSEDLEPNICGLVKYGKNLYARDWDHAELWKSAGLKSDKDVTGFLTRLFPQLFIELYCYKHSLR